MRPLLNAISYFIATGFYSGLTPKLPGTAGSAACLVLFLVANQLTGGLSFTNLFLMAATITIVGSLAVAHQLKINPDKQDPQFVVVDEWAGLSLAFCAIDFADDLLLWQIALFFVLFRFFDIVKPWPISAMEKLPGAAGVMLDDLLAGALVAVIFGLILTTGGSM